MTTFSPYEQLQSRLRPKYMSPCGSENLIPVHMTYPFFSMCRNRKYYTSSKLHATGEIPDNFAILFLLCTENMSSFTNMPGVLRIGTKNSQMWVEEVFNWSRSNKSQTYSEILPSFFGVRFKPCPETILSRLACPFPNCSSLCLSI